MGRMCEDWGKKVVGKYGYSGVGAVVGATYPEMLTELRGELPKTFFLVPGYGAQVVVLMTVRVHLTKTVLVLLLTHQEALCVHGRRLKVLMKRITLRLQDRKLSV